MNLNEDQKQLHYRALTLARKRRRIESELIQTLQEIDHIKLYKIFDCPSLFVYATRILDLSESIAYAFISVSRKAKEIPSLQIAIQNQEISVSKASRVVSSLDLENAAELIAYAKVHTLREIEFKLSVLNPKRATRDRIKPLSNDQVRLTLTISKTAFQKLKRAESLAAQKGKATALPELFETLLDFYLKHNDPVQKAERQKRNSEKQSSKATSPSRRQPLTAEQKHAVFRRDKGRCTHLDASGARCNQERWIQIHHLIPVSEGGSNEPENLTTLCSFHHDLVHQLNFGIDGQVSWLRAPTRPYRIIRKFSEPSSRRRG